MQESSELEERRQHVFRQVKPCCVSLLGWLPDPSPTSQNDLIAKLDALLQCLRTIENSQTTLHESLLQYISFPLLQTFTKGCLSSDTAISLILDCLGYLVDNCFQNMGLELQVRIFLITLEFLGEKNETQSKTLGVSNFISEELKLQSAKLQAPFFFNKSGRKQTEKINPNSGFFLFTEQEFSQRRIQLIVARSVHTFVYCIKSERLLDLRLAVLRNFNQLISDLHNTQILAQFFPGIITGLSSIVMDNVDRGHSRLLVGLLGALEKAIVGTLNDDVNATYITSVTSLNQLEGCFNAKEEVTENDVDCTQDSKPDENMESFQKNPDWIVAAHTQTKALLIKVLRIRSHHDWKVRNACLKLCFKTISHCHKLLSSCFSILIETLVLGLKDTYPEIVTTAREYLEILFHDPELANSILTHSKQNFYNLIDSLPGTLTRHDELVKYNALSLCAVYLQLINRDIDEFLSTNFNDFVSSLILSLELDDSDIQLLETRANDTVRNGPISALQTDSWSWIPNFKNINEERTLTQLSLMFRTFGYYGNIVSMMDKLLSHLRSSKRTKDEVIYVFIINELLKGASGHIDNDAGSDLQFQNLSINTIHTSSPDDDFEHQDRIKIIKSIARVVLREYLSRWNDENAELNAHDSQFSNKATSENNSSLFDPKSTRTSSITLGTAHYSARIQEILTIKSIFYGTACIAKLLGRGFRLELLNVLYPLMEMMGHESVVIYNSATRCAESIRVCCQYTSVQDMIAENADYLVNAMSHKFAFSLTHSQVSQVLQAFLSILGTDALPLIEDIIDDILDTLDNNRSHYDVCSQLLGALDDFLGLTLDMIKSNQGVDETADRLDETVEAPATQFDNFLTWYKTKADESDLLLETLYASPQIPETTENKEDTSENKTDESRVSMTITQKSIIYLSARTSKMRSLAISIFGKGLKIVDKSAVFSLINDAWPSLYHLLESKESFLVFKVVRLIQEISNEHAEFVSKRFVSQIWPYFARFLTSSRSQLLTKRSSFVEHSFHPDHHDSQKLLSAILEATSSMLLHLNIPIQQVRSICEIVAPFVSDNSDPQVQEAISQVFISVAQRFPDVLWVFLNNGCSQEAFDRPSSQLNPVVFPVIYDKSMQHACNSLRYLLEDEQH